MLCFHRASFKKTLKDKMLLKEAFCCQSAFVARLILALELRSRNCYHFECMGWSFEMSLLSVSTLLDKLHQGLLHYTWCGVGHGRSKDKFLGVTLFLRPRLRLISAWICKICTAWFCCVVWMNVTVPECQTSCGNVGLPSFFCFCLPGKHLVYCLN